MLQNIASAGIQTSIDVWPYLAEVNHRTMNEYADLVSIVRVASASVSDRTAKEALDFVDARLCATARAHRALCPPGDGIFGKLDDQLQVLCAALSSSLFGDRDIHLTLFCESIPMTATRCWQASLIVSELIANAAQRAFVTPERGAIVVDARVDNGQVRCTVTNNGDAAPFCSSGLGSALVDALTTDLGGLVLRRHSPVGSTIGVFFPQVAPTDQS